MHVEIALHTFIFSTSFHRLAQLIHSTVNRKSVLLPYHNLVVPTYGSIKAEKVKLEERPYE